jgi:hypothetical protein
VQGGSLNLRQCVAATLLRVNPRIVRRSQTSEQEVLANVADPLKAWLQLAKAHLPWTADMESILRANDDQIECHQDYALALDVLLERVKNRDAASGGPAAPWRTTLMTPFPNAITSGVRPAASHIRIIVRRCEASQLRTFKLRLQNSPDARGT